MKTRFNGRKISVKPAFVERTEKKLAKFDKFFEDSAAADVTITPEGQQVKVEITLRGNGMVLRAEQSAGDANAAVDMLLDTLLRQIRRNKAKLEKRLRMNALDEWPVPEEPEEEIQIVRTKSFPVKPMDVREAVLQMQLVGHQFYMFRNVETGEINVVYCRKDGGYGLLEPENAR